MATEEGRDSSTRDSSFFDPPEYEISYGEDHTLQWIPPAGSKELAVALSYHFPMGDLESKMRAATKKFLKAEAKGHSERIGTKHVQSLEENFPKAILQQQEGTNTSSLSNTDVNKTPINAPTELEHVMLQDSDYSTPGIDWKASPSRRERHQWLEIVSWKPEILGFKKKALKRRYEKEEREKVAANRGYACEEHRRRKMKVSTELPVYLCPINASSVIRRNASTINIISRKSRLQDQAIQLRFQPTLEQRASPKLLLPTTVSVEKLHFPQIT